MPTNPKIPWLHTLIIGSSGSGKTTCAAAELRKISQAQRMKVGLTPHGKHLDPRWRGISMTSNPMEFAQWVNKYTNCIFIVDEIPLWMKHSDKTIRKACQDAIYRIACAGREYGQIGFFISQSYYRVEQDIREQCTQLAVFNTTQQDCENIIREVGYSDEIMKAKPWTFPPGKCLWVLKYRGCVETVYF